MRVPLFIRVVPVYCALATAFILPASNTEPTRANSVPAAATTKRESKILNVYFEGKPIRVTIPDLALDVDIEDGSYDFNTNEWSVSESKANYATNTAVVNNKKNKTLIYGHWTPEVFGPTKNLAVGDKAIVNTEGDHIFTYTYSHSINVAPTDTDVFASFSGAPGLVLMTCDGIWAQERRLMYFDLETVR